MPGLLCGQERERGGVEEEAGLPLRAVMATVAAQALARIPPCRWAPRHAQHTPLRHLHSSEHASALGAESLSSWGSAKTVAGARASSPPELLCL